MEVSTLAPASVQAGDLVWLFHAATWVCGFIFVVVTLSLVYIAVRFRRKDDTEPAQIAGNTKIEIVWTVIPFLLVTLLFVLSIVTAEAVDRPVTRPPDIIVTGHQWWWDAQYPAAKARTANEIHIPVGRDMLIEVHTADVIHDFWVPRLGRKIDALPGLNNAVWIHADRPGTYLGACSEYCGSEHAWMRFRVIAEEPAAFEQWLARQAQPAAANLSGEAALGAMRFQQLACANCHPIRGTMANKDFGPDLTHLASRKMLAAERLENTPDNLRRWLEQPKVIKPDCHMPNSQLSSTDLNALTAYLGKLQ